VVAVLFAVVACFAMGIGGVFAAISYVIVGLGSGWFRTMGEKLHG